jgi:hypothetical protein
MTDARRTYAADRKLQRENMPGGDTGMQRSPDVERALRRRYERFSANDVDGFAAMLSPEAESMVIGTSPTEWYDGRDAWVGAYAEQIVAIPGVRFEAGAERGWEEGSAG